MLELTYYQLGIYDKRQTKKLLPCLGRAIPRFPISSPNDSDSLKNLWLLLSNWRRYLYSFWILKKKNSWLAKPPSHFVLYKGFTESFSSQRWQWKILHVKRYKWLYNRAFTKWNLDNILSILKTNVELSGISIYTYWQYTYTRSEERSKRVG